MGSITILGENNFTSQFYVKKVWRFQKSSLIDPTQHKMAIFGHIMAKFSTIWVSLQFWVNIILQTNFISGSMHGVRDASFSWLRSYLTDRQQFVKLSCHTSVVMPCDSCVLYMSVNISLSNLP